MKQFFSLFLFLIFIHQLYAGNPVSVPLDKPVYRFLDRMETLGILDNMRDGVRPLDRERISQLLLEIDASRDLLTGIDRHRLDNYLLDFRYEIDYTQKYAGVKEGRNWYTPFASWNQFKTDFKRLFAQNQPEEDNHLYLYEDSTTSFYFDLTLGFNYDTRSDEVSRRNQYETYQFRGTFFENLGYMLRVSFVRVYGDDGYRDQDPILKSTWVTERDDQIYFDRSGGDLAYRTKYVDFHFAYQPTTWGPGESGQLILSDNIEQYPYFSVSTNWSWGNFTYMHGKLLALANGRRSVGSTASRGTSGAPTTSGASPTRPASLGSNTSPFGPFPPRTGRARPRRSKASSASSPTRLKVKPPSCTGRVPGSVTLASSMPSNRRYANRSWMPLP